MNLVNKITSTRDRTLSLYLEDEIISIHHIGSCDGERWYSWSTFGPSEGGVDYSSECITANQVIERISLLMTSTQLASEEAHAIDLFFGKAVTIED